MIDIPQIPVLMGSHLPARALYSPQEVESILGCSHAHLYRMINAGHFDVRKLMGKTVITAQSIVDFINELPKAR